MRLDLAVSRRFGLSRRAAREAVRTGRVDVGGATQDEPGTEVPEDALLSLHLDRTVQRRVRTRLSVLYEDGDVLVVDKPAGLLTVPTEAREKDTLWSRALFYLQHRYGGRPYAGIVHRLDKDTSGALVFARNRAALHFLQDRFREHAIDREYVALVEGATPDSGSYEKDLVRTDGLRRSVARPGETGRRAVTRFRTLQRLDGTSLVSVRLETGRTHQIRVHFSAAGHPVVGDRVYRAARHEGRDGVARRERRDGPRGGSTIEAPRQMLHARRLGFAHPATGRPVVAESPLPPDYEAFLSTLSASQPARPAGLPGLKRSGPARPGKRNGPAVPGRGKHQGNRGGSARRGR